MFKNSNSINNHSLSSSDYSIQTRYKKLVEEFSNQNEIIIDELLSLLENAEQKGINKENNYGKLIRLHMMLKNINKSEIFKYLLENKDKRQNIILLAIFYQHGTKIRSKHSNYTKKQPKKEMP